MLELPLVNKRIDLRFRRILESRLDLHGNIYLVNLVGTDDLVRAVLIMDLRQILQGHVGSVGRLKEHSLQLIHGIIPILGKFHPDIQILIVHPDRSRVHAA